MRVEVDRSALRCPYCHGEITPSLDWKACAVCVARHHAACWDELQRCGTCGGREVLQRSWLTPGRRRIAVVAVTAVLGLGLGGLFGSRLPLRTPSPKLNDSPSASSVIGDPDAASITFEIPSVLPNAKAEAPLQPQRPKPATAPAAPPKDAVSCHTLSIGFDPAHAALTHDGRYLLLASRETDRVVVWDWEKDEELRRIPVESGPCFIFVRGNKAYVCNGNVATISVIDIGSFTVVNTFKLPAGQPRSITAASDRSAPAFVSCGDQNASNLVRLDLATGKASVVPREQGWGLFTMHSGGRLATWQGEGGQRWLYEVGSGSTLKLLGYRGDISQGPLFPDRRGKYWFGTGCVWDAGLTKQVATLEHAQLLAEHPSSAVLVGIDLGQPYNPYGKSQQGTVTFFDATRFTVLFSHAFTLPPAADGQNRRAYPYGNGWSTRPLVVEGTFGTVVLIRYRGNVVSISIPPETYAVPAARLSTPFPTTLTSGLSWSFQLSIPDAKTPVTFKAIELPQGCELDAAKGVLTWECPTSGEYDFAIKAVMGSGDEVLIEERVMVEQR
jgi:hypothetical protein